MTPLSIIGALSALPLALAHMQMSSPSPLRDPHANRPNEPKDYNILNPLNADGSNFACKGYHLNTPLTTVATYAAGSKQTLKLKGSATHGGGSCQISLSCDGGSNFNVLKSIMGGCPLNDSYTFKVPSDIPAAKKCLLAWTWFNRIGNREMYMNCAVVDITNKSKSKRDTQISAAKALSRYPDLFVANLANINSCKTQEITDVIFDNPGKQVSFGNGDGPSMKPSFGRGQCTGKPSKYAGSKDSTPSYSGGGGGGQWAPSAQKKPQQIGNCATKITDGQWHPECYGGHSRSTVQQQRPAQQQEQQQQPPQAPKQAVPQPDAKKSNKKKPNTLVQQELDAYLATLYGRGVARRNTVPAVNYPQEYVPEKGYTAQSHAHIHTKDCKHKITSYPPGSHYHNSEDLDPYPEDGIDYANKNIYHTQDFQNHEDPDDAYKRAARQKRWNSYTKRAEGPRTPIRYHRGDESAYYQQQGSSQASAQGASTPDSAQGPAQVSTQLSTEGSGQTSTDTSAQAPDQAPDQAPAQKSWNDMTESERFEAFLRRMVELSSNMASLIKYAAATSVNIPYYPPASTYASTTNSNLEYAQNAGVGPVRRHARRGILSFADTPLPQVYPGPAVGSISASGDATDADDGFKTWFPDLVQGLMTKRQLVDPVTSQASADAGDSINFFDALLAGFWKAFGDPFNIYGDKPDSDPVPAPQPDSETVPLVLGEPDFYHGHPDIDFPDFEIPDLDGHYTFPPQILAPEPPIPTLLPGYEEGPDGPVWVGDGPDPLGEDPSSDEPIIIISIEPIDGSDPPIFPGEDVPTFSPCVEPIPQIGFNSCLGGCNHTAEEIAAHGIYLDKFADEQAAYEECLKNEALDAISSTGPSHGIYADPDSYTFSIEDNESPSEAEDASGRRPRPGTSHPLIPYPLPLNFTGPYPSNSTSADPYPLLNATAPATNDTPPPVELQPYQNKTLGELVNEILNNPDTLGPSPTDEAPIEDTPEEPPANVAIGLTPVPSDSSDDLPPIDQPSTATNPLQEAANQAEDGVTVPTAPVEIDPSTLESIADALPWFLGPGPVVTGEFPADVPAGGDSAGQSQ